MANTLKVQIAVCLAMFACLTFFSKVVDGGACKYIPFCNSCTYDNETKRANCHECDPFNGITKVNGFSRCESCSRDNSGCLKCKDFESKCELCHQRLGAGPDPNNKATCSACSKNCRDCRIRGSGKCDKCEPGCKQEGDNCLKCEIANCRYCGNDVKQCSTCESGFFLKDGNCEPCVANCRMCFDSAKCQFCKDSYFVDDGGQCSPCIENCRTCGDTVGCKICKTGFFLRFDGQKCEACDENCYACTAKKTCTSCKKGRPGENGSCSCADNCESCSQVGNGKCDKGACIKGFVESEGKGCKRACSVSHCKSCSQINDCDECENGYTLDGKECVIKA